MLIQILTFELCDSQVHRALTGSVSGNPASAEIGVFAMIIIFQGAIVVQSLLFAAEAAIPPARSVLPLGGSQVSQSGIVMAIAVAAFEVSVLVFG